MLEKYKNAKCTMMILSHFHCNHPELTIRDFVHYPEIRYPHSPDPHPVFPPLHLVRHQNPVVIYQMSYRGSVGPCDSFVT